MNRFQRAAIILSLIRALREKDSWCGETNIQKACYFLQELLGGSLGLEFVLYKYGPYSFELTDELTAMRADAILALQVRDPRYGPCYVPTELSNRLLKQYPKTISRVSDKIPIRCREAWNQGRCRTRMPCDRTVCAEEDAC